jgi:hypothetical protein
MKVLYSYIPASSSDSSVMITGTTAMSGFPLTNLKYIQPVKSYKTNNTITEAEIIYDFGSDKTYNSFFINRFNFAAMTLKYKATADPDYSTVEAITGLTKDEIADENYMHRWIDLTGKTYRYLKLIIPAQTPLFEATYFKVGNILVGNYVEISSPKSGYKVSVLPKMSILEFESGYISTYKKGRSRRSFSGSFDKLSTTEYNKISQTYSPFVIYQDFENDKTKCYLVRAVKEYERTYQMADLIDCNFELEEVV